MRKLIRDKKGITEIFMILAFLSIVALVLFLASHITQAVVNKFQGTGMNSSAGTVLVKAEQVINLMDKIFVMILAAMIFGILITVFTTNVHPAFVVCFILLAVIAVFVSIPLSNSYEKMSELGSLSSTASKFPMQNNVMTNLPMITLIVSAVGIIIMFAKSNTGEGGMA